MTNRDELANVSRKVKALLQRTQETGCTEAEAEEAARKAHELLAKYQLNLSDLDLREEGTAQARVDIGKLEIELQLASAVANYCDCKCWRLAREKKIVFLGLKSDVFFAEWLLASLTGFCQRETVLFSLDQNSQGIRYLVESFKNGATRRISDRLNDEVASRRGDIPQAKALVICKKAMVDEAFARLEMRLTKSRQVRVTNDKRAFSAGVASGDKARFNKPVASGGFEQKLLS